MKPKRDVLKRNLLILTLWPILAAFLSLFLNANYFWLILFFYGVPSLFLSIWNKNLIAKNAIFSLLLGIPGVFILEYLAEMGGAWSTRQTIFNFLVFGTTSVEDIAWGVLIVYFISMFFEYFIENKDKDKLVYPNMKYLLIIVSVSLLVFSLLLIFRPDLLSWRYSFLKIGIAFLTLPLMLLIFKFHIKIKRIVFAAFYFAYFNLILEITALSLNIWGFPGEFIGWINILNVRFPFEELFFWIILSSISIMAYHEYFDDAKNSICSY